MVIIPGSALHCNLICRGISCYNHYMTVLVINTHDAIKRLIKAGQNEESAEAIVELITEVHEQVVTKTDLKNEIQNLEQRITIKLYTVGIAIIGVLAAFKYWG